MPYELPVACERQADADESHEFLVRKTSLDSRSKRIVDVAVAASIVLLALPLIIFLCGLVKLDGGPIFFRHSRLGARGRSFKCLKFRTMVCDGERVLAEAFCRDPSLEQEWHETQKMVRDPRVTRVGRVLRDLSLDEIPQLFNVLRNEMSLVGPRPITSDEVARYGRNIHVYYSVRPGMTGLWQISGRSTTTYNRRVALDVRYAEEWCLSRDFVILLKTIPAVLLREGAH